MNNKYKLKKKRLEEQKTNMHSKYFAKVVID